MVASLSEREHLKTAIELGGHGFGPRILLIRLEIFIDLFSLKSWVKCKSEELWSRRRWPAQACGKFKQWFWISGNKSTWCRSDWCKIFWKRRITEDRTDESSTSRQWSDYISVLRVLTSRISNFGPGKQRCVPGLFREVGSSQVGRTHESRRRFGV